MRLRSAAVFLLLLVLAACSSPVRTPDLGPIPTGLPDGRYLGEAEHFPAKAKVEVVVRDGRVADVILLEHRYGQGGPAGDAIPGRIVEEQSTDVDAVSGATGSSILIMQAVEQAIDRAHD